MSAAAYPQLQAGLGILDYTPTSPDGAFTVYDPVSFRALLLRQGEQDVVLLAGDFFSLEADLVERARAALAATARLARAVILPCASHIGTAPILFRSYVKQRQAQLRWFDQEDRIAGYMAQAIARAEQHLRPVQIGMATAGCPDILYNRRSYDQQGQLVMSNFLFPYPRPELTYGDVDENVYVLRVDDLEGNPLWASFTFGCHALCSTDRYGNISADYPGVARRVLAAAGIDSVFLPGAIGNVVPVSRGGRTFERVGNSVGAAALYALEQAVTGPVQLEVSHQTLQVPTFPSKTVTAGEEHDGLRRHQIYGRTEHAQRTQLSYPLTEIRFGDASLLHMPGEIFVETAAAVRAAAAPRRVVVVSGPTADVGYLATPLAHQEGGMEPQYAGLAPEAEPSIRAAACALVHGGDRERVAS